MTLPGTKKIRSLRSKLLLAFFLFAIVLLALLWILQTAALETVYKDMRTRDVVLTAKEIESRLGKADLSSLQELAYQKDIYVQVESDLDSTLFWTPFGSSYVSLFPGEYDTQQARELLRQSPSGTVSYIAQSSNGHSTLVYAKTVVPKRDSISSLFEPTRYLYLFAPLEPVGATVQILRQQLLIVTAVSLLLAGLLAYFLSKRLAHPLSSIASTATELQHGHYGVQFEGSDYTEAVQLADTLTLTSQSLARSDELKKDLLANVSHDLRTPLTMIRSYAEMVRDLSGDNPVKRSEHLNVIIDESDRMNRLVGDLLTLSKMQSGTISMKREPFSLYQTVQNALSAFTLLQEQEHCIFDLQAVPSADENGVFTVTGDADRMEQVLHNLLTNAVRYSGDSKKIEVRLQADASSVTVSVRDYGIGISPEDLEHIWDRYYRSSAQAVRSQSGGSGLGLAITKEILVLHSASYGVDSTLGEGSTFWFTLQK